MSFALTTPQILDRSKTVTRRLGWERLKKGARLRAVKKAMGFRKGEKAETLAILEVVSVRRERLMMIACERGGARKEGFPGMRSAAFIQMFCRHMRCEPETFVTRIEFRYVDQEAT